MQNTLKTWIFDEIFPKNRKLELFSIKLTINLTIWVENSEKLDFLGKQVQISTLFLQIITCGYILAQLLKQLFFPPNQGGKILHSKSTKISTNYCRKHRNSPDSPPYTIEYKIVRNSYLLSQNWHFLKCHSNCSTNKV